MMPRGNDLDRMLYVLINSKSPPKHWKGSRFRSLSHPPSRHTSGASSTLVSSVAPDLIHKVRLVPFLDPTRALLFDPITREIAENGPSLQLGRLVIDENKPGYSFVESLKGPNDFENRKVRFDSKVISREHAEIWVEDQGKFYIKDVKSSSGTFLNRVRLSSANVESTPFALYDGDIIQLGVDYIGSDGEVEYRCVKIKVELGAAREWQAHPNEFNKSTKLSLLPSSPTHPPPNPPQPEHECIICLSPLLLTEPIFISPCSHPFHYACIRPLLEAWFPAFECPVCRTFNQLGGGGASLSLGSEEGRGREMEGEEDLLPLFPPAPSQVETQSDSSIMTASPPSPLKEAAVQTDLSNKLAALSVASTHSDEHYVSPPPSSDLTPSPAFKESFVDTLLRDHVASPPVTADSSRLDLDPTTPTNPSFSTLSIPDVDALLSKQSIDLGPFGDPTIVPPEVRLEEEEEEHEPSIIGAWIDSDPIHDDPDKTIDSGGRARSSSWVGPLEGVLEKFVSAVRWRA